MRLSTSPAVFGDETLTLSGAWGVFDAIRQDFRVGFSSEPPDIETTWRAYTVNRAYSHRVWSDAYLAAFAVCARLTLVSFDKGFETYEGLSWVTP